MNEEQLVALEGSIRKWEAIVKGEGEDRGPDNCPLCQSYFEEDCVVCPVFLKTGEDCCVDTPYDDWCAHHSDEHQNKAIKTALCPECTKLAKKEVKFLKSLRPKK